jgi:hypothetical protein
VPTDDDATGVSSRSTIGLTAAGERAMEVLMEKKWFATNSGAFKAAVAYAIASGVEPTVGGSFKTIWNVGTLDKSGDFSATIAQLLDVRDPWDAIQGLGDAGVRALAERVAIADVPTEALLAD